MTRTRLLLVVAAAIVTLDQVTKAWAVRALDDRTIVIIEGFLELDLTLNPGAAFSSLQDVGPLIGILAIGVAVWLVILIRRRPAPVEAWGLALVLGGAVGNLVDRLTRGDGLLDGAVVDFVDLWWIPTFNVADMAITFGAATLLTAALISEWGHRPSPAKDDEEPSPARDVR
jgi:signal peptidase II